jgi:hypothetical protein
MRPADPVAIAVSVAAILDELGIRYVIGGSVASSLMGEPRSTLDLDLMIECDAHSVRNLVARLKSDFYVDESEALHAVVNESTFNAIHLSSSLKVDFFIAERAAFARHQLERRQEVKIAGARLNFYSPEDLIVRKLMWFKLGGEISDRQWRDILGIIRTNPDLDRRLLREAARETGVDDLLNRAVEAVKEGS